MTKTTLRIATDQFCFVEQEIDVESPIDVKEAYDALKASFEPQEGIPTPEFNATIDEYMNHGSVIGGLELWGRMSDTQKFCFQEIKKSMKRLEAKNTK